MPIYEYRCLACGHQFERMQKFSDPPVQTCDVCAGAVQKLISRSAFHLKGSGWYVTDYGRNGGNNSSKQDTTSETTGTSEGSTSTDSSATKSDAQTSSTAPSSTTTKTETATV